MSDKSNLENRVNLLVIALLFVFLLSIVWIVSAIRVDSNASQHNTAITLVDDGMGSMRTVNRLDAELADMKNSDFWAIWLASHVPFIVRVIITIAFLGADYHLALYTLRKLNFLLDETHRESIRESKKKKVTKY